MYASVLYLLLGQVLCDLILVNILSTLQLLPLDLLDAFTLNVASTDQHALQSSETEVIMALG